MMPSVRRPVLDRTSIDWPLTQLSRPVPAPVGEACARHAIASGRRNRQPRSPRCPGGRRTSPMRRPSRCARPRGRRLLLGEDDITPEPSVPLATSAPVRRAPAASTRAMSGSPVLASWQAARCDRQRWPPPRAPRSTRRCRQPHDRLLENWVAPTPGDDQVVPDRFSKTRPDPCACTTTRAAGGRANRRDRGQSGHAAGTPGGGGGEVRARRQRV